jgi:hypothetical protein
MTGSPVKMSCLIRVRLTREDKEKLAALCAHTQRQPSDLVRTLIRLAKPFDVPAVPVGFTAISVREEACEV